MKVKLTALIAAGLIAAMAVSPVSAAPGKENYGSVGKVAADAVKVDGKKDSIYGKGLNVKNKVNGNGISANAWLLWSDGYLYVYADVTDATRDKIAADAKKTSPWTTDSFEIFVDDDNDGKNYGMQYRVDSEGYGTWKDRNANKNYYTPDVIGDDFKYAAIDGAAGYSIEMRVPMSAKEGAEVGINFQINGIQASSYLVQDGWNTPEYGFVTLSSLVKTETASNPSSAAQTADPAALLALASIASTGVIAFRKKR